MKKNMKYYDKEKLILRDHLALDRTILSNERTLLSYIRTCFAFILLGITFFKLFTSLLFAVLGIISIAVAMTIMIIGFIRYFTMNRNIRAVKNK